MRSFLLVGLSMALALNVWAAPSSKVAWTPQTLRFVKNGNAEHGKQLAATCVACHTAESEYPLLDGQLATYLYRQLHDYKDGSRRDSVMSPMVENLTDQDLADLAAWFSQQQPFVGKGGAVDPTHIAVRGDGPRMEPPCISCHGGSGQGQKVDTPRLAGQKAGYLEKTLLAYKDGTRANDIYSRMRLIAGRLNEKEIKQLADYYSKLE